LPRFLGGWFAAVRSEVQLATGLYDASTVDLLAQSGLYARVIGAEAGSGDMLARIKKSSRGNARVCRFRLARG
jgi:hypothetical protein